MGDPRWERRLENTGTLPPADDAMIQRWAAGVLGGPSAPPTPEQPPVSIVGRGPQASMPGPVQSEAATAGVPDAVLNMVRGGAPGAPPPGPTQVASQKLSHTAPPARDPRAPGGVYVPREEQEARARAELPPAPAIGPKGAGGDAGQPRGLTAGFRQSNGGGGSSSSAWGTYSAGMGDSEQRIVDEAELAKSRARDASLVTGLAGVGQQDAASQGATDMQAAHDASMNAMHAAMEARAKDDASIRAEITALSKKGIDPDAAFGEKGSAERGFRKVMAGLGYALGAFGANVPHTGGGGRNYALEMVQGGIRENVEAQKADLKNKWEAISQKQGMNKDAHARDIWMAEQMGHATLVAQNKAKLLTEGWSQRATSSEAQARLQNVVLGLTKDEEAEKQKSLTRMYQYAVRLQGAENPALKAYHAAMVKDLEEKSKNGEPFPGGEEFMQRWQGRVPVGGDPGGSQNPLAGIPKSLQHAAQKELEDRGAWDSRVAAAKQHAGEITSSSTRLIEHPVNAVNQGLGVQNTEGNDLDMATQQYNTTVNALVYQKEKLKSASEMKRLSQPFVIRPGDGEEVRKKKVAAAEEYYMQPPATPILSQYGKVKPPAQVGPALTGMKPRER